MKCLYCHENVQPEGDVCPKCGLPLIEDTTLLELSGPEKPSVADWLQERKAVLLAAAGGFAAALVIGIIILSTLNAGGEPAAVVNPAAAPAAAPLDPPVQMAARAPVSPYGPGGPVFPSPRTDTAPIRRESAPDLTPASTARTEEPNPGTAPTPSPESTYSAPPPLPDNFEYDPAWGFPAPPKPPAPRRRPDPVLEPTPPAHTLAMDPTRARQPQYVTVIRNRGVSGVETISGREPVSLLELNGE